MTYDAWKTRSPDDELYRYMPYRERGSEFECSGCDDMGCDLCCPLVPITLDDLEEIQAHMDAAEKAHDDRAYMETIAAGCYP
jgi:hypothetical protein